MIAMLKARFKLPTRPATEPFKRPAKNVPRTQDQVRIVAARDDALILRDGSVVAGVGFGSVERSLLPTEDVFFKLKVFRDSLLKHVGFPFQMLIGTRPQNLDRYVETLSARAARLAQHEDALGRLRDELPRFVFDPSARFDRGAFAAFFGFAPDDLEGLPGRASDVAWALCDAEAMAGVLGLGPREQAEFVESMQAVVSEGMDAIARWQSLTHLRAAHAQRVVTALASPVRTLYFITSFNPRIALRTAKAGTLSQTEMDGALTELDGRCQQIIRALEQMKLPCHRARHEELLRDIQYLYHPSQAHLLKTGAIQARSVASERMKAR